MVILLKKWNVPPSELVRVTPKNPSPQHCELHAVDLKINQLVRHWGHRVARKIKGAGALTVESAK